MHILISFLYSIVMSGKFIISPIGSYWPLVSHLAVWNLEKMINSTGLETDTAPFLVRSLQLKTSNCHQFVADDHTVLVFGNLFNLVLLTSTFFIIHYSIKLSLFYYPLLYVFTIDNQSIRYDCFGFVAPRFYGFLVLEEDSKWLLSF